MRTFPTAKEAHLSSCHTCGLLASAENHHCERCGEKLHLRKRESLQRCLALLAAAMIAYIPANVLPIMIVTNLGVDQPKTIMQGVVTFWAEGSYPVAVIIFVASVMIPALKLIALLILTAAAMGRLQLDGCHANRIYLITEIVGRWSMVDVFVVVVLVGLVQLGNLTSIHSGPAALAFGLTVVLTMMAAHSFDPRLIWDQKRERDKVNS